MSGAFIVMWVAIAVIAVMGVAAFLVAMSFEDEPPPAPSPEAGE